MQIEYTLQNYFSSKLHTTVQTGNRPTSSLSARISVREFLSRSDTSRILCVFGV